MQNTTQKTGAGYTSEIPKGIDLIAAERNRQVEDLGFTDLLDAGWTQCELASAAACYAAAHGERTYKDGMIPVDWPFSPKYWKPTPGDRVRELVKAGALFMAENDRLKEPRHHQQIFDIAAKIDELQKA